MTRNSEMRIERGVCYRALFSLFADKKTGLAIDSEHLTILARHPRKIPFSEISGLSYVRSNLFFSAVEVPLMHGRSFTLGGIGSAKAKLFVDALNDAWETEWHKIVERYRESILQFAHAVDRLENLRNFQAACVVQPLWKKVEALVRDLPTNFPDPVISPEIRECLGKITEFHHSPGRIRDEAINRFTATELMEMASLFDSFEKPPLTDEQRHALICDDDATLVLAGVGSGKTSVITAKAAYLIIQKIRKPSEVLLMAFGIDAAREMSKRITKYCDADIAVKTFHKLAYDIIAEVEGRRPLLAKHAADQKSFQNLIREILIELAEIDKRIEQMLRRWFTEFLLPAKSEWDFKTRHEYYSYVERYELRTLQGEKVRSFEELEIANWLCMNGITYEYEPVYVHISSDTGRKPYTPDFRLTACGVYIEHFGVRRKRDEDGNEFLTTAPYVDREKYLIEMEWKRNVHTTYGTTLVETFSYEKAEGRLLPALEEKIAPYVDLNPIPLESILSQLSKLGEFDDFTKTLATFLRHFKGSDLTIEMCKSEAGLRVDRKRESAFLEIFERVYGEYQKRLGERIDFDDMISRATDYIKENRYRSSFRHLLVDEFQDISTARANLLIALKKQDPDARIFAVGDDWQSIYRFTGSNINLMQNFGALFGGILGEKTGIHRIVKLENTFRCVDRIANPARRFILKNPSQIEKNVIPAGTSSAPAISVLWSEKNCYGENLEQALIRISNQVEGESVIVLLIGRYNWLRPDDMEELNRRHTRLSIFFKSIHASKGLEADHVIILGAESGRHGLPSEIVDDPLLDLVLPQREPHEHAEERRVFYVALTRARESITIIVRSDRPSSFVKELLEDEKFSVSEYGLAQHRRYPCSKCGGQMILARKNRYVCEHWDNCDASLPLCSACGISMPLRIDSSLEVSQCECGAEFAACTECIDGWLVRRNGKYSPFLGCVNYPSCKGRKSM